MLTCVEICAGAGGQALGLSMVGFSHLALVEYEQEYCDVPKKNRPDWNVICADVKDFSGIPYRGKVDLFAGGVPCLPFSVARCEGSVFKKVAKKPKSVWQNRGKQMISK